MPASAARHTHRECSTRLNMTPMIDIVFQLLIFFILAIELQNTITEDLNLPEADQARLDINVTEPRTTVNVTEDGTIKVTGRVISPEELHRLLDAKREVFRDQAVRIRSDRDAQYCHVQQVMGICKKLSIHNVSFGAAREDEAPDGQ